MSHLLKLNKISSGHEIMTGALKILLTICVFCLCAAAQQAQQQQETQTEPVKILTRPGALYTALAERERVEGDVVLRVTFQADGKIGEVIDMTGKDKEKLSKSGLTANAVEAARKIKFVPAKRDGKPIAVRKIIVYTFTL